MAHATESLQVEVEVVLQQHSHIHVQQNVSN